MQNILKIISYTKHFRKRYITLAALIIIGSLLNQVAPLLNKQAVDIIVAKIQGQGGDLNLLVVIIGLVFLADILVTVLTSIGSFLGDQLAVRLNNFLSQKFYDHVLKLPIEYFDNERAGAIVNRLDRGIRGITDFINQSTNAFVPFILTAIITLIIISFYSIPVALLLALLFPLYVWISNESSKRWTVKENAKNVEADIASARLLESVNGIRVVKSFVTSKIESLFYRGQRQKISDMTRGQSAQWHRYDFARRIALNVIFLLIYGYVIYLTFRGTYTIGEMTLLLQLSNQARFPLFALSFIIGQIQMAEAGSKGFFDVMAEVEKIKDKKNAKELRVRQAAIEFKKVSFKYNTKGQKSRQLVLDDVSFKVPAQAKVALVGESGEGKSTIANLLLRFYEPKSGQIRIDKQNISDVTQDSLRTSIGVVFQDPYLFSGSVRENIAYSKPAASLKEIEEAAKAANAHEFIKGLPQGYDSEIGERGVKLSGGQKQRVAIARAILKDAPVLVLDEATSSLDTKAEREVQAALERLMRGRTTLIIAHRLSTIQNVDKIIVIGKGKVTEEGSPAELAQTGGIYAELLALQSAPLTEEAKEERLKEFELAES